MLAPGSAVPRLILITDPALGDDYIVQRIHAVASALPCGSWGVQLRDKARPAVALRVFASRLRAVTRRVGALLSINGHANIARDVGADSVHLKAGGDIAGARALIGPRTSVSIAAHSDEEVRRALEEGAHAILVSPILPTRSLAFGSPAKAARGFGAIESARAIAGKNALIYALGGVTSDSAVRCAAAGANGVALIRPWLAHARSEHETRAIHDALARR